MNIVGLQKHTLVDYPDKVACTVFTQGCNYCCGYCHNPDLIPLKSNTPVLPTEEFLEWLISRKKWLDGVCLSIAGDEPTVIIKNGLLRNDRIDCLWDAGRPSSKKEFWEEQDCEDIEALTFDGVKKVSKIMRHEADELFEVLTEGGYGVKTTGSHSVFVITPHGLETKKTGELTENDYLLVPKKTELPAGRHRIIVEKLFEKEFAASTKTVEERRKKWIQVLSRLKKGEKKAKIARKIGVNRHTILAFEKAEKNDKLEEALYCSRGNQIWRNGKFICVGKTKVSPAELEVTTELAELLGYATAEGSGRGGGYVFSLGDEPELAKRIAELFEKLFAPFKANIVKKKAWTGNKQYQVLVGGKFIKKLFEKLVGRHAENKRAPPELLSSGKEEKKAFLFALHEGDGSERIRQKERQHEYSIKTISRQLSSDLTLLLSSFGVYASVNREEAKGRNRPSYNLCFYGNQFEKIGLRTEMKTKYSFNTRFDGVPKELIGAKKSGQNRIAWENLPKKYLKSEVMEILKCWRAVKVKKIKKTQVKTMVYDLVVEGNHSFTAGIGQILVHNTGGEPTLQRDLPEFARSVKDAGFLFKLDSNGSNPTMLKKMFDEELIDFLAMDIKAPLDKYSTVVNASVDLEAIKESVRMVMERAPDYEFRTTVAPLWYSMEDAIAIGEWLKGARAYYLQNFVAEHAADESFRKKLGFAPGELEELKQALEPYFEKVGIRD